jgi:glycosyltransferase involved in cell wall biosynthesis
MAQDKTHMMKILLVAEDLMLNGVTRHIIDLANGLAQHGHTVVVAAAPSGEEARLDSRVISIPLSLCWPSSYKKKYRGIPSSLADLLRIVRKYDIQIIHTHKRYADIIGRIVARLSGISHCSTCHNEFYNYKRFSFFGDTTIAPCESIAWMLIERFHRRPESVEILPYGIQELSRCSSDVLSNIRSLCGIHSNDRIILSVGHLNRQKDRPTLLEAVRILRDSGREKNVVFLIVGEGEEELYVRSILQQYQLEGMVKLLPARSNIAALNELSDFCVLSSINETWAYVLLEAASMGKPFVATNVGCIPSFMVENAAGVCVPSKDPVQLAEAVADLLDHPEDVRRKGECARKRFEQYHTYNRFIEHTIAVYYQALSKH